MKHHASIVNGPFTPPITPLTDAYLLVLYSLVVNMLKLGEVSAYVAGRRVYIYTLTPKLSWKRQREVPAGPSIMTYVTLSERSLGTRKPQSILKVAPDKRMSLQSVSGVPTEPISDYG
jgi:hypothetical protein